LRLPAMLQSFSLSFSTTTSEESEKPSLLSIALKRPPPSFVSNCYKLLRLSINTLFSKNHVF
jgi:hypothetical protein